MGCSSNSHSSREKPKYDPNAEGKNHGRWILQCSRCGRFIKAYDLAALEKLISWPGNRRGK